MGHCDFYFGKRRIVLLNDVHTIRHNRGNVDAGHIHRNARADACRRTARLCRAIRVRLGFNLLIRAGLHRKGTAREGECCRIAHDGTGLKGIDLHGNCACKAEVSL